MGKYYLLFENGYEGGYEEFDTLKDLVLSRIFDAKYGKAGLDLERDYYKVICGEEVDILKVNKLIELEVKK